VTRVFVRPAAAGDIEDAFLWYEEQRPGLGEEFLEELNITIASIVENPGNYPVMKRETRRVLLRRFPYGVYYRVLEDRVLVVACYHARRDPRGWQKRT
jgi:plasmid stabilization system protein ParE